MIKKITLAFLSSLIALSMTLITFASEYPLYLGDGTVEYQNTLTEAMAGKDITFLVIGVDKIWDDTAWQAPTDEIVFAEEATVGVDGTYEFNFRIKESGVYNVLSAINGETKNIEDKFEVILSEKALEAAGKLKAATSVSDVNLVLEAHKYDLGVTAEISDALCLILLNSKDGLSVSEPFKAVALCKKAVKADEINKNKISSLTGIEDTVGIKGSDFEKWYKPDFDSDIVKRISGKNFTSVSQLEAALKEAVLLERIENPDGNNDIVTIVSENYSTIGLSTGQLSLAKAGMLAGGNYPTYLSFKTAFETGEGGGSSDGGSTGGGSTGGGGSSSGGSAGSSFSGGSSGSTAGNVFFEDDSPSKETANSRFQDMSGFEWARVAVDALALKGVVNGKGNGKFAPADYVTREEFAKMIVTLFNFNVVPDSFNFVDVPEDSWYYSYVRKAYGSKVLQGVSENMFGSGQNILRQDAIVMAYNALKYDESLPQGGDKKVFLDAKDISDYAAEAIATLSSAGLILGDDKGNVSPKADITRAEAAMIIYNIMTKLNL